MRHPNRSQERTAAAAVSGAARRLRPCLGIANAHVGAFVRQQTPIEARRHGERREPGLIVADRKHTRPVRRHSRLSAPVHAPHRSLGLPGLSNWSDVQAPGLTRQGYYSYAKKVPAGASVRRNFVHWRGVGAPLGPTSQRKSELGTELTFLFGAPQYRREAGLSVA
jgi:hypothetical protein